MFHSTEPDGNDENSCLTRIVHQIFSRLDILEDIIKESSKFSNEAVHSGRKKSSPSPGNSPAAMKSDQFLSDFMMRSKHIEHIKRELRQIHETILNYFQIPRPITGGAASPSGHRLNIDPHQGQLQSSKSIREEDFMRTFIDKKVKKGVSEIPSAVVKQKRKRRRRPKNDRGYRSEEISLSGSWEDVSHTEVESIF